MHIRYMFMIKDIAFPSNQILDLIQILDVFALVFYFV